MSRNPFRCLFIMVMIFSAPVWPGCARNASGQALPKAEAAVEKALDSWARGEAADKFADASQPVHFIDPDWKAGYRLLSFLSFEAKQSEEKSDQVRCRVALSLQDRQGKKVDKKVIYAVQLGNNIVIGRDPHKE